MKFYLYPELNKLIINYLTSKNSYTNHMTISLEASLKEQGGCFGNLLDRKNAHVLILQHNEQVNDRTDVLICGSSVTYKGDDPHFPILTTKEKVGSHCSCEMIPSAGDPDILNSTLAFWSGAAPLFRKLMLEQYDNVSEERLRDLEKLGGQGVAGDGIKMLIRTSEMHLKDVRQQLEAPDHTNLARIAHQIKGSAGTLGAERLSQAARAWEIQLNKGILDDSQAYIALLFMLLRYFECFSKHWA